MSKRCLGCLEVFTEDEIAVPSYECSYCGLVFSSEDSPNGKNQCPDCLKFASKLSAETCPTCGNTSFEDVEECTDCGEPATTECSECGAPLCDFCGDENGLCSTCQYDAELTKEEELDEDGEE